MYQKALSQACHFDWGEPHLGVENFAVACVEKLLPLLRKGKIKNVLDVGSLIGRSSFELARYVDMVVGVESQVRFVREAQRFKESGVLRYSYIEEGEIAIPCEVYLNKFGLTHASKKVNFWQGNPMDLKRIFKGYDLILVKELLTQVPKPSFLLDEMLTRLRPGGFLVITSIYDWNEDRTVKSEWIGGYIGESGAIDTLSGIARYLSDRCRLVETYEIPIVSPLTKRSYRYGISQMSIWHKV